MKRHKLFFRFVFLTVGIFLITLIALAQYAHAFQIAQLPGDNLIQNPWFRDLAQPSLPGFDHWVNVNNAWTLSQKISNPAPYAYISGKCDSNSLTYCGTSAKLSADDGNAVVGVDAYLYQIVSADPTHTKLKFSTYWVTHLIDPFEINIYGSTNNTGPWTLVWTPLYQQVLTLITPPPGYDTSWLWLEMTSWTPPVETILSNGFPYYKVEIHGKLPSPEGFKITGVYFAAEEVNGPPQTSTPTPTKTPPHTPSPSQTVTPTPNGSPTPFRENFFTFLPAILR